jgi:hypothetical protein
VRYHLMAAIKLSLLGAERLARSPRRAVQQCQKILDVVWDPGASERLVFQVLPAIARTIEIEKQAGVPLGEMVRNRRFADRMRRDLLGAEQKR